MWRLDRSNSAEDGDLGTICREKHIAVIVCVMGHGIFGARALAAGPAPVRHTAPGLRWRNITPNGASAT